MTAPTSPLAGCRHMIVRTESFVVSALGERTSAEPYYLCDVADDRPELFAQMPGWILREALSCRSQIKPDKDCRTCPLFAAGEPKVNP